MWHEARRSERKVNDLMDAARRRAQRRAVFLAKRRGDPQQLLQVIGSRCRVHRDEGLYQATQDQQGLIPWNGKQDILIDRFDGRALLDYIRDSSSRPFRAQEKSEEEEELEEFVNFERYWDLIKHRRRGYTDEEALHHVVEELEAKSTPSFTLERTHSSQPTASKGSYSQVGFSYNKTEGYEEPNGIDSDEDDEDDEDDDDEKDVSSDESNDEGMELIAKEFGIKRYNWLVYMDKKTKEEEKRQKEVIRGDPSIRKLSRKERRKVSQMEREKEREAARILGRAPYHDPYRESRRSPTYEAYPYSRRSRSRSRSPSYSRRHDRGVHSDDSHHRSKPKPPKIEYITEFGGPPDTNDRKVGAVSPPSSPLKDDSLNRSSGNRILEALHVDPASALSLENDKNPKISRNVSTTGIAKLTKAAPGGSLKAEQIEKKETPQERLKRIMNKQLNKQIKKDSAAEMAKKREQERQRLEKLAETNRLSRHRRRSHSRSRSRSRSRSPARRHRRSRSHGRSRSRSPRRHYSRSSSRSRSPSRSPRVRSRYRY
ncbi:CLK4-associating serine/arginine rich protein isoform X4 [Phalaenopsis equestris]|uniref:CLK4-associating serine/arginine rich protein isoform X4 n=1 Tax=Phalaenopsis equestris TaxID=78828 RepID=UPI0009E2B796|nr:CLK4-associating serine/arginine rich protein isoform X4 [Phalaenopsis equestris]